MERLLWSGTAGSNATIIVPNITDYSLFSVNINGHGTSILCRLTYNNLYGSGGCVSQSGPGIYVFGATIDESTEQVTIRDCGIYDGNSSPLKVQYSINSICGII